MIRQPRTTTEAIARMQGRPGLPEAAIRAAAPPQPRVTCPLCKNFAWHGRHVQQPVRVGAEVHHPSCPQVP